MMLRMKERITISVGRQALDDVRADVAAGRAPNVSAAIEGKLLAQRRRQALRELLDSMDAEYGPLTEEEKEWGMKEVRRALEGLSSSTPEG
jgi:Arc/MetJ-type ribon-helix-helix transcriptional regulator